MTSWRYVPHFFLFVLLIDLSKEGCLEYFDFTKPSLAHNLEKTFPVVKPKNTTDLQQYMVCTLEKSKGMDETFPYILEQCFESGPAEGCSNETLGNISYYNLMCMTVATVKFEPAEKLKEIKACHLHDYETLFKLLSHPYYATLSQMTLSPASPTSTSPTAKTTTTTTPSETTQIMLPTTETTTTTTSSKTTQTMLPTTKTTTTTTATTTTTSSETTQTMLPTTKTTTTTTATTTTTSSETTQTMLPTTKTTTLQKANTRAQNKTPRLSPTSATTKTASAQPASYAGGSRDNLKLCGPSPATQEVASPDNVLKYLLLLMGLILLLLTTVYLYKRLRTRVRIRRENNAESYSLPLEITQPTVAERNEEEDPQLLDAHEYEHAIVDNNLQMKDTAPLKNNLLSCRKISTAAKK